MPEERVLTLHPAGKEGVNILKRRYDVISDYIINSLKEKGELSFKELMEKAESDLKDSFDGKIGWYIVTVKLDLEARKIIERIPKSSPHRLKLYEN